MDLKALVRDVPDFPKPGVLFKDIMPVFADPAAFGHAVRALCAPYRGAGVGAVAGAEARGFLFAAPMALELNVPLIPLRKPGKLPGRTRSYKYDLEYGSAELHVRADAIAPGTRVLLVDDVLATGGTMAAACKLVEEVGGAVVACAFFIELAFLNGRAALAGRDLFSLLTY